MTVTIAADNACAPPSHAHIKWRIARWVRGQIKKVRRSNPLSKPPTRKWEAASSNHPKSSSSLKQTRFRHVQVKATPLKHCCILYSHVVCQCCWRPKPPQKFRKSHWCVPFTATFSKRRKIGALWSERCDAWTFQSITCSISSKIFASKLCQLLQDSTVDTVMTHRHSARNERVGINVVVKCNLSNWSHPHDTEHEWSFMKHHNEWLIIPLWCDDRLIDALLPQRVCCAWRSAMPVQHARASEQAQEDTFPNKN